MTNLGIVIPAYNCEKTIRQVINKLPDEIWKQKPLIAIVNDGSTDKTTTIIDEIIKNNNGIFTLIHKKNKGYGAAQKTGLKWMLNKQVKIVAILHSDGQYAPEEMPKLIAPIQNNQADVVVGSRMLYGNVLQQGMPLLRFLGNKIITFIENKIFNLNFSEYHCGYAAYSYQSLKIIPFMQLSNKFHFDGEMLLMAGKTKLAVAEIPISTNYHSQASSLKPIPYLIEILGVIIKYLTGKYNIKSTSDYEK